MKKNTNRTVLLLLLITFASGCSWFGKNEPEYTASVEHEPLKIPAGLDTPRGASPMIITSPEMRKPAGDELEPLPPLVTSSAGRQNADTYLAWSAEGVYLFVKGSPDNAAVKIYKALEEDGMTLLEDSVSGAYKFHYKQPELADEGFFSGMAFWRDKRLDYSGTFMTSLQADGDNTRVFLLFGTGEAVDSEGAEHVLAALMDRME